MGPSETPRTSRKYSNEGFKGGPQLVPHYVEMGTRKTKIQSGTLKKAKGVWNCQLEY